MSDFTEQLAEQLADLGMRVDAAERAIADIRQPHNGTDGLDAIELRLTAVEKSLPSDADSLTPEFSRGGDLPDTRVMPDVPDEFQQYPQTEIEWGKVVTAPTDHTLVSTITLTPCEEDGTNYAGADVVVHIRNDRSTVGILQHGWTVNTVLSFIRYPLDVGTAPTVIGVLVGGDDHQDQGPAIAGSSRQYIYCYQTVYRFDNHGNCLGWYYYSGGWNWESPWNCDEPGGAAPYG